MSTLLVLAGLALVRLPGLAASTGMTLRPSEWARLNRVALALGLCAVQLGLVFTAAPTVLRAASVESLADTCHRVLGPVLPGGSVTGWVTAAAALAVAATTAVVRRRARRLQRGARIDEWLGEHRLVPGATLVVLPTDAVVAYATPGPPRQAVVSRGLVASLSADEIDAVIDHELAHLRNGHDRDLVRAAVVDATLGWIPGLRASTAALRLSIERCADEEAAAHPGARDSIRRALVKTTEKLLGPVPAFTAPFTLLARLDALAAPAPRPGIRRRATLFAPLAGLATIAASCVVVWSVYTHHRVLGLIGSCPV